MTLNNKRVAKHTPVRFVRQSRAVHGPALWAQRRDCEASSILEICFVFVFCYVYCQYRILLKPKQQQKKQTNIDSNNNNDNHTNRTAFKKKTKRQTGFSLRDSVACVVQSRGAREQLGVERVTCCQRRRKRRRLRLRFELRCCSTLVKKEKRNINTNSHTLKVSFKIVSIDIFASKRYLFAQCRCVCRLWRVRRNERRQFSRHRLGFFFVCLFFSFVCLCLFVCLL